MQIKIINITLNILFTNDDSYNTKKKKLNEIASKSPGLLMRLLYIWLDNIKVVEKISHNNMCSF